MFDNIVKHVGCPLRQIHGCSVPSQSQLNGAVSNTEYERSNETTLRRHAGRSSTYPSVSRKAGTALSSKCKGREHNMMLAVHVRDVLCCQSPRVCRATYALQVASLCGVHCLNTLLQGPTFSEMDLGQVIPVLCRPVTVSHLCHRGLVLDLCRLR